MRGVLRVVPVATVLALLVPVLLVPRLFGWVGLPMTSAALEPGIPSGSLIIVDPVASQNRDIPPMKVGDVVTFTPQVGSDAIVTRRITAIEPEPGGQRLNLAPGERASTDEMSAQVDQVRGIACYHVPFLGKVIALVPPTHRPWWARAFALAALAYAAWQLRRRREDIVSVAADIEVKHRGGEAGDINSTHVSRSRSRAQRRRDTQRSATQRIVARLDAAAGTLRVASRASRGRHRASSEDVEATVHRQNLDIERVAMIHPSSLENLPTSSSDAGC